MKDTRSDLQYRKTLVKLLKDAEKKGGQPIPNMYVIEIMTTKSIDSVKREVKRIENKNKKLALLKDSQKPRTFAELSKIYIKLRKKQGYSESSSQSDLNIFYKNKKALLEKHVLSMESKMIKKKSNKVKTKVSKK